MNFDFSTMEYSLFNRQNTDDVTRLLLDDGGKILVHPASVLQSIPQFELSQFCVERGIYCIPTTELIAFLREEIGANQAKTIEIGAGNGVICRELDIIGTDNFMQQQPAVKAHYHLMRQATVPYGEHVLRYDALQAVGRFRPKVVIAAWCTHKYDPREHERGGNEQGIDEKKLLQKVEKYIHIGNSSIHAKKPILNQPHREIHAPWLYSRSLQSDDNIIYVWEKEKTLP